jgi:uncharacterized protein YbjT (DUF2867 family)
MSGSEHDALDVILAAAEQIEELREKVRTLTRDVEKLHALRLGDAKTLAETMAQRDSYRKALKHIGYNSQSAYEDIEVARAALGPEGA